MTTSGSEKWPAPCRGFGHYIGHRRRVSQFFMLDKLGARQDNGMVLRALASGSLGRCCSISCRAWRCACGHCFQLACREVKKRCLPVVFKGSNVFNMNLLVSLCTNGVHIGYQVHISLLIFTVCMLHDVVRVPCPPQPISRQALQSQHIF